MIRSCLRLALSSLFLSVFVGACSGDDPTPPQTAPDTGDIELVFPDAGRGRPDASQPGTDASQPLDAGQPGPDAGQAGLDAGQAGPDAGQAGPDAGQPGRDAGQPGLDAGQPGRDAGQPGLDAGQPGRAAGQPGLDAGQPGRAAGPPGAAAGPPGRDAGQPGREAGQPGRDAGQPGPDAGQPGRDAGQPGLDAGQPDASPTIPIDNYWGNTQWPAALAVEVDEPGTGYGRVWIQGRTEAAGATTGLFAEAGVGPAGTLPSDARWNWFPATFNTQSGNNDEFMGSMTVSSWGVYDYAFRYTFTDSYWNGTGYYLYGDLNGTNDGYTTAQAGKLYARGPGATFKVATLNLKCLNDDPDNRLKTAAARFHALGTEFIALQEVCKDPTSSWNMAEELSKKLAALTGRTWLWRWAQTHEADVPGFTEKVPEGIALLTVWPIEAEHIETLPNQTADFIRKALFAVVRTPAGAVTVVSTHLSHAFEENRQVQAQKVLEVAQTYTGAVVIGGDFNSGPSDTPVSIFKAAEPAYWDVWLEANPGEPAASGYTFPATSPTDRIDHLLARPGTEAFWSSDVEFSDPTISDHRGVSAILTVP